MPVDKEKAICKLNIEPKVIQSNGHNIDCNLIAHLYEFIDIIENFYSDYLDNNKSFSDELIKYKSNLSKILEEHFPKGCMNILCPPELKKIKNST
jgi:hypothetical protein